MVRFVNVFFVAVVGALLLGTGCHDDCDLEVETSVLPDGIEGEQYAFELESDCGGDEWRLADGSFLPPGITLNDDGELRGTPTQSGSFSFTVEVLEFNGFDTEHAFAGLSLEVHDGAALPTRTPTRTPRPTRTESED